MLRLALFGLIILAQPAQAAIKGCFTRTYDAAHLAKHKGQDVTFMALQIGFDTAPNATEDDGNILLMRFRGNTTLFLTTYVCVDRAGSTHCKSIDDAHNFALGGSFVLTEKSGDILLTPETDLNLVEEGTFTLHVLHVANNPEHKVFKLRKLGKANCPVL